MNAGRPRVWHALAILACCVLAYWIALGATGLSMSEGHRVGVAWEWLDAPAAERDWLVTRLFERVYVRKPQGVPWALAASSAVFGQTELAVRAVSAGAATLLALGVWWFAGRWFGWRYAWTAGCAMALLPWTWESGRAAEIEAAHNLGVGLACVGLVDLLIERRRGLVVGAVAGVGLCVALLAKGPAAGLIVLGAALGGLCVARSWRAVLKPGVVVAIALPTVVVGGIALATAARLRALSTAGEPIVAQSPGAFLWESGKTLDVLVLLPVTLVMALPASLALLFPWGPDAASEPMRRARDLARAATWGVLAAGVLMTIAGVSNPRYMLPVAPMVLVELQTNSDVVGQTVATSFLFIEETAARAATGVAVLQKTMLAFKAAALGAGAAGLRAGADLTGFLADSLEGTAIGDRLNPVLRGASITSDVFASRGEQRVQDLLPEIVSIDPRGIGDAVREAFEGVRSGAAETLEVRVAQPEPGDANEDLAIRVADRVGARICFARAVTYRLTASRNGAEGAR